MLTGLLCAFGAAVAYGAASILQAIGARRAAAAGSSLTGLAAQPIYYLGLALDGAGFVGAVAALHFLPLFLVQAVTASSVLVTAVLATLVLGARLGGGGVLALGTAVVGLVLLALSAQPQEAVALPLVWRWVVLGGAAPIAVLGWWGSRHRRPPVVAFAAGLAFTVVAISARSLDVPDPLWHVLGDPLLWAVAAGGIVGTLLFAVAVQIGDVTRISAITFTTETVLPATIGLLFLGDEVQAGFGPVAAVGFVLAVAGAITLSRFAEPGSAPATSAPRVRRSSSRA